MTLILNPRLLRNACDGSDQAHHRAHDYQGRDQGPI
jgi:hypothetical protein